VPDLAQHLQVVAGALLDALRLQQLVVGLEPGDALLQLRLDLLDGLGQLVGRRDEVLGREDVDLLGWSSTSPVSVSISLMRSTSSPHSSTR
jgi:hypothetical protein